MSNETSTSSAMLSGLLDENSFVELMSAVTAKSTDFNLGSKKAPSDGVITGHGLIDGSLCFVFAQDASVLGGSIGEMHAKKILSIYDMALKAGAPVIGLIDSTGVRLEESFDALEALGSVISAANMAKGVIPQIMCVTGNCGGGLSVLCDIADFTYMVDSAKLYINSPDAICDNKCDNSSAEYQMTESGVVDFAGSKADCFAQIRKLVSVIPACDQISAISDGTDDLNRASVVSADTDVIAMATELADNREFLETKAGYSKDMVTGFIKLDGITVGVIGNKEEELTAKGCKKATGFVEFCDDFNIPILTITGVTGYCKCKCAEKNLPIELARLSRAFSTSFVPKINLIPKKAIGSAYILMNSKSVGADLVFAFEGATIGAMEPSLAAKIIAEGADTATAANEYAALQANASGAASRGYVDRILSPADARKYIISGFEMLLNKMPAPKQKGLPFGLGLFR